jgi:hypothetical protein
VATRFSVAERLDANGVVILFNDRLPHRDADLEVVARVTDLDRPRPIATVALNPTLGCRSLPTASSTSSSAKPPSSNATRA